MARGWTVLVAALLWLGCPQDDDDDVTGDDDATDDDDSADDDDTTGDECIETAAGSFPAEAEELAHTEDGGTVSILDFSWNSIEAYGEQFTIGEERMWEGVRFDLLAPATVYGARVMWGGLAGEGVRPVTIGAYDDFGSNGFDFFQWEARWTGDRCLDPEADLYAWVDYVFAEPIEVPIPGLFFMANEYQPTAGAAVAFDETSIECNAYEDCKSAINFPDGILDYQYNGLSLIFPYEYSIRLMVEYHDTVPAEDKWFQLDEALSGSSQVAWGDYDHDGWDDLMTNGPTLYHNNGDGSFTNVTTDAGLDGMSSSGVLWGDYDNDGCLDFFGMYSGNGAADILVHSNCDGTFTDVTLESGIDDSQEDVDCNADGLPEHSPTPGAAWVDVDSDGYLDLYLANYECSDPYEFYEDRLFRNNGDGTFADWSQDHGLTGMDLAGRGVSPVDVDRDGDTDIFVSNYRLTQNLMYENLDGDQLANRAIPWGLAGEWISGAYGHTIGSAWIDLENDGDWDLIEANLAHPRYYHFSDLTMVLRNDGDQAFEDIAAEAGIHYRETHSNPTVQDFDNDGDWDLFVTCVYDGRFSELYLNDGSGSFTQANYESGAIVHNGWGSAASDYDNDGDVDLLAYDLFRNDTAAAGNHFVQVRAIGGLTANWAALGAVVEVDVSGQTLMSHVSGGSGTGCQDSQYLSFGLGEATEIEAIRVTYPGGAAVEVAGPIDADQRVWIYEDGSHTFGWAP